MGQSALTIDEQIYQGTTTASGILAPTVTLAPDQVYRITAYCYISTASAGHLNAAGAFVGEYVIETQNAVGLAPAAVTGSTNPDNFAGLVAAHPEAADTFAAGSTGVWSVSGNTVTLTITVQTGTGTKANGANVTVLFVIHSVGST